METCIIYNPHAGRRQGGRQLKLLRRGWAGRAEFLPTSHPGHAEELAKQAAAAGYRVIAAAGGDGTAHEVANGILQANRPDVHFALLPLGSANDYAYSIERDWPNDQAVRRVDVGTVSEPAGKTRYFICCLGLGFNGAVTLESRRIRWLRGIPLYGLATLRALMRHFACPPLELSFDDFPALTTPTLMLSVLIGQREGSFVLAPSGRIDDGWFDYVHAGALTRWQVLKLLPQLAVTGPPQHHARIKRGRCKQIHLRSESPLMVHVDGEFFCTPADNVRELTIRLIPLGLTIARLLPNTK